MSRAALLPARKGSGDEERLARLRGLVRAGAENRPGVYQMAAEDGAVLYVGQSKRVRTRLLGYFRCEPEEKGARILRETSHVAWEYCPSEFAALLAELRLIRRLWPRFNVAMKRDLKRYAFIKVTRGPAPKLHVVRGPARDPGALYYGPFTGAGRVREDDRRALARLTADVYGPPEPAAAPVPLSEIDEVQLLSSWFQRYPDELARTQPVPGLTG
ncbi:GIY-YIG nuclease family protein [Sorangium cellulosum]|uniref:GIY-YIG domain-containing protein n=1 Tax=Sorangium cellulosum So0157-2 TaxID=1254432 RepID=S4Y067_SORCE|nr:GIY-YIG nuclease family protein [Sorangium cellulosum]AGP38877.1 hypothetical protein SCE1572_32945 [Sorangium cellulosum So0157-2]